MLLLIGLGHPRCFCLALKYTKACVTSLPRLLVRPQVYRGKEKLCGLAGHVALSVVDFKIKQLALQNTELAN